MSRRTVLLLALVCLALAASAVVPWAVSSERIEAAVAEQLRREFGVAFSAAGRTTVAFLPMPRLKIEDIALEDASGALKARGGQIRGAVRLLPLLGGRVVLDELSLTETRLELAGPPGEAWQTLARLAATAWSGRGPGLRGVALRRATVAVREGASPPRAVLNDVDVALAWPGADASLEASGRLVWRGEAVTLGLTELRPERLARGEASPFAFRLAAAGLQIAASGEARGFGSSGGDAPLVTGRAELTAKSLRDFVRWSGLPMPLAPLAQGLRASGAFRADRATIAWPALELDLGGDPLEGALSARWDAGRPVVNATLAAERLDLSQALAALGGERSLGAAWSGQAFDLSALTDGDLDVRVSAAVAKLGALTLQDAAASLLVRPGRIEAALGRAGLHRGTLKGRLALAAVNEGAVEAKLQGSFERVDVAGFLGEIGASRWLSGSAQGQIALESVGHSPQEVMRQVNGRVTTTVRQGEIVGLSFGEALRRNDRKPATPADWRGGRTGFDQAQLAMTVSSGVGEISEGAFTAPNLRGLLQGRVSLADRTLAARATVDAVTPGFSGFAVEIAGPWERVAIGPEARTFALRSGLALPLLPPPDIRLDLDRDLQPAPAQ